MGKAVVCDDGSIWCGQVNSRGERELLLSTLLMIFVFRAYVQIYHIIYNIFGIKYVQICITAVLENIMYELC